MLTGGQMPGTAQLAATASIRFTPDSRSKTRVWPVSASTATSSIRRDGHSGEGSRELTAARRSASGTVRAASA